jgi:hypothetical protein
MYRSATKLKSVTLYEISEIFPAMTPKGPPCTHIFLWKMEHGLCRFMKMDSAKQNKKTQFDPIAVG